MLRQHKQRLHCSSLLRFVVATTGLLYLESALAFVGIIPRVKQRGVRALKDTEAIETKRVREESISTKKRKELMSGPNFLKVLYNPTKVPGSPLDLAHDNAKMMTSPRGQYYPFGMPGYKVMLLSGETLDIILTLRAYLELYSSSDEEISLRIVVPYSTKMSIISGERHDEARQTLSQFYLEDSLPSSEGILFLKGTIPNLLITAEWILEVVNSEEHREDMKKQMTYIFADRRLQHKKLVEISFQISNGEATLLIGKGGNAITNLCEHFKISISVNDGETSDKRTVVLTGTIGDVHQAHFEIIRRLSFYKDPQKSQDTVDDEDE